MLSRLLSVLVALATASQLVSAAVENEGATCTVTGVPDLGSLTTISKLPDPFKKLNGQRMTSKSEWNCRREEIKKLAEKFVYGEKPPKPTSVTGTVSSSSITINVSHNGKSSSFSASVSLPSGTGPFPAVIVYGSFGGDTATIKAAGAAIISYDPYTVGKEGTGRANKQGAFYSIYGSNSQTGLLNAWGWGVSRIIDVIESNGGSVIKPSIGVTGCSRFGKGSFLAGVFDQRVALTMPIESGSAGVPILRGIPGEGAQTLSSAYGEQPWFGDAFGNFTSSPTRIPIDTHEVAAYIAPRGLFIMENPHIANLGPKSGAAAALGAQEVYNALGVGSSLTYISNVADGSHCANRPEWKTPLTNNIKRFLLGQSASTGGISMHSSATTSKATWIDWTTPSLSDGGGGSSTPGTTNSPTSTPPTSTNPPTSTTPPTTSSPPVTTPPGGCTVALYGQCGGQGWAGCTTCGSGTCKVGNPYYSQCL